MQLNYRLIIYDQIFIPAWHFLVHTHVHLLGPMHPNSKTETFPDSPEAVFSFSITKNKMAEVSKVVP